MTHKTSNIGFTKVLYGVVAMSLLLVAGCGKEAPPPPPKPIKAIQISDPSGLTEGVFPGRAQPSQEANMSFRVSGPLVELPVSVGDVVTKGTLIAKIDPNDFQVALTNAESLVTAAQAAARRADADYDRLISAQQEDPGAVSQRAVDLALAARDEARAAVSSTRATAQTARDRLGYTSLEAPFDAEVSETYVENFETVIALQPIVRLVNSSSVEMTLSIPENLIGYADFVTSINVTFDALPDVNVPAVISEVGSEASQSTRTYPLTIVMDQPDGVEIKAGMAGNANIQAQLPETASNGVHVPPTALFAGTNTEQSFVWVVENDAVTRREVQTGDLTSTGVLITSGLAAGETIVAAGVSALSDGQAIKIIATEDSQ